MKRLANVLSRKNKRLMTSLIVLLVIAAAVSVYSFAKPATATKQISNNTAQLETSYDYKATVTPNVLHPDGGTIEVEKTIFKKITSAIPVNLKSIINSEKQVKAKGTHEAQLVVKAGELWQETFPLEDKQTFSLEGTDVSIINNTYKIDLNQIKSFITQVEEETGVSPDQYALEVIPNIEGTITSNGMEKAIHTQGNLAFNYSYNEIELASEKSFASPIPFAAKETITNTFRLFGSELPLQPIRTVSTLLVVLLLTVITYAYKDLVLGKTKTTTLVEKINKKYGDRIIPVTQKVNISQKSIFSLDTFKSVIKIADERELPIFCYVDRQDGGAVYFIVDGDYLYRYKTSIDNEQNEAGDEKAYAKGEYTQQSN